MAKTVPSSTAAEKYEVVKEIVIGDKKLMTQSS